MKYVILPLLILVAACGGSETEEVTTTEHTADMTIDERIDFDFVNHQTSNVDVRTLIDRHQEHLPFYLKLTSQKAGSNIYLGIVTTETIIDDIETYLPSIETRIRYEIFNRNGYQISGYLDI